MEEQILHKKKEKIYLKNFFDNNESERTGAIVLLDPYFKNYKEDLFKLRAFYVIDYVFEGECLYMSGVKIIK
jgi:hypothetical protein